MENIKFEKVSKVGKVDFKSKDFSNLSKIDSISPPSVFIGSKLKYPNVNVGILSPVFSSDNAEIYDDMQRWAKEDFSISDVIKLRSNLLNSRFRSNVHSVLNENKFVSIAKDIAIASKPVDLEIELKNKISSLNKRDKILAPTGLNAELKNANIVSNIKVEKSVDKVINDELKSVKGMNFLYNKGISEYNIQKILSIGALGLKKDKKMVPTRWSITATDDVLSKESIKEIKNYSEISDYELFFGEYLGNQYLILLFPGVFSFELFELYYPGSSWNQTKDFKVAHDYEDFYGRKDYAFNCAGGYYATRLPIVNYLKKKKRQAGILVVRLETPSYWAGLGVWVVRESVKKAIENGGKKFADKKEFLESVRSIGKIKYDFDISQIYFNSWLLKNYSIQKKLQSWF